MSIELKSRFNQLAMANRYPELSDEQWGILVEGEDAQGMRALAGLVSKAGENIPEAMELLKGWHKAVRLTDTLRAHGFPDVSKRDAKAVFDTIGQERVSNTGLALRNGDPQAKNLMQRWLSEARGPATSSPAPAPTRAPPATDSAAAGQRFSAVPPPPGVVTGPPRPSSNGQAPASRGAPDNVSHLPATGRQAPRQEARGDDRYERHDRDDRGGGEDTTGRHHAPVQGAARPADNGSGNGDRQYDQHSCYGKDVAVTFECTPNRERTANTVNIKVAKAKGGTCKQGVDWKNGIIVALEPHEVQTVAAVLLGYGPTVRCAGHGHDNQKWFELTENTGDFAGAIRLTMAHGQDRRSVNIGATDIGEVTALFLRALGSQLRVEAALYPSVLRRAYDLYQKNSARRANNGAGAANGGQQRARANA